MLVELLHLRVFDLPLPAIVHACVPSALVLRSERLGGRAHDLVFHHLPDRERLGLLFRLWGLFRNDFFDLYVAQVGREVRVQRLEVAILALPVYAGVCFVGF